MPSAYRGETGRLPLNVTNGVREIEDTCSKQHVHHARQEEKHDYGGNIVIK
jgi:hypothetical protein